MKKDQIIKCEHCNQEFVFTQGEQEFYKEKGLSTPIKCPVCRAIFKEAEKDKFRGTVKIQKKAKEQERRAYEKKIKAHTKI